MSVKTSSLRRLTAAGLAALIAAGTALPDGSVFKSVKAEAAESTENIVLGLNGIDAPQLGTSTSDSWRGSYVWFGEYNGNPLKFRVLDPKS